MPEYPDITLYVEALRARLIGARLARIRLLHPFLLRSVDPMPAELEGRRVESASRLGKQIILGLDGERFLVIHLMIAGRLRWVATPGPGSTPPALPSIPRKNLLASFELDRGALLFTEAGTKKRASLHLVRGREGLVAFDRGGLELFEAGSDAFREALLRENHTLKRALTDPRLFSGIGNAYSDEILHRARLSPLKQTRQLADDECSRLFDACRTVLREWTERLRTEVRGAFPEKVTAFHEGMAAHGKFGSPCPVCGTAIQRIVYAENECNYCPDCQTGGRLLADRSLSRLLKGDWPRSIEELEGLRRPRD